MYVASPREVDEIAGPGDDERIFVIGTCNGFKHVPSAVVYSPGVGASSTARYLRISGGIGGIWSTLPAQMSIWVNCKALQSASRALLAIRFPPSAYIHIRDWVWGSSRRGRETSYCSLLRAPDTAGYLKISTDVSKAWSVSQIQATNRFCCKYPQSAPRLQRPPHSSMSSPASRYIVAIVIGMRNATQRLSSGHWYYCCS
jgi:hypothetical protein